MTVITGPLFKWFGSKWLSSKTLPKPLCDTIYEPYAGSAGYSLRYGVDRKVVLSEQDPNLRILWKFLIRAKERDIREIPINIPTNTDIRDLGLSVGQTMLLKHWQRTNNVGDCWTTSPWGHLPGQWTANTRARVASEVGAVSHWRMAEPAWCAYGTYFVDPPYLYNYRYRFKKDEFDHDELAQNVRSIPRSSQVIVCEAICQKTGAVPNYLPFEFFGNRITSRRKTGQNHHSKELIYTRHA
jgi:site-specific DNA-adenine methylase